MTNAHSSLDNSNDQITMIKIIEAIKQSINVTPKQLEKMYKPSVKYRNNLLHKKEYGSFSSKVCCSCDRLIFHGDEKFLPVKWLENNDVQKCFQMDNADWEEIGVDQSEIKEQITENYQ